MSTLPVFARETPFSRELRARVGAYFTTNNLEETANNAMRLKIAFWLLLTYGTFGFLIFSSFGQTPIALLAWSFCGFCFACVGFNVSHDAIHGSTSKSKLTNFLLSCTFDGGGVSSEAWRLQHNTLHHTYTNVAGLDLDIEPGPLLRFQPDAKHLPWHRFQAFYVWPLYCFVTLLWVFQKDFIQAMMKHPKTGQRMNAKQWAGILAGKCMHGFFFFGMPYLAGWSLWQWLGTYLVFHASAGFALAVIFQLAHVVEGPGYTSVKDGLPMNFFEHQLHTTANFGDSGLATFFVGGLNYQVEHHLFPRICHIHYPALSKIVKQCCAEFGVPYHYNGSTWQALKSHVRRLHALGQGEQVPVLQAPTNVVAAAA
jgi:linoleoyl-CoA desaturase